MRLAVVSPFVDSRHGTERALAELLVRLARDYHCTIHLYAQRVEDLALDPQRAGSRTEHARAPGAKEQGEIIWHKVPAIPGPHLVQFVFWLLSNAFCRWWNRTINGLRFDLVLSPGINCFDADVVLVHALFHRLGELANEEANRQRISGPFRHLHRRTYYSFLTWLERRIYSDSQVFLAAASGRTASYPSAVELEKMHAAPSRRTPGIAMPKESGSCYQKPLQRSRPSHCARKSFLIIGIKTGQAGFTKHSY